MWSQEGSSSPAEEGALMMTCPGEIPEDPSFQGAAGRWALSGVEDGQ